MQDNNSNGGMPKMLRYSGVKPRGFASRFRRWQVFPQTSYQNYNQNDIIRFNFQTEAFIDPYSSYVEIEITFNPNDYGGLNKGNYSNGSKPAFMLDGPSTTIFNQLVLYSNSKEIERIQEYDALGNILADLGVPVAARVSKAYEGYQYDRVFGNANSNAQLNSAVGLTNFVNATNTLVTGYTGYATGQEVPYVWTDTNPLSSVLLTAAADNMWNAVSKSQVITPQKKNQLLAASGVYGKINYAQMKSMVNSQHGVQSSYYLNAQTPFGKAETYYATPGTLPTDTNVLAGNNPGQFCSLIGYQVPFTYGATFSSYTVIAPMYPVLRILNGVPNQQSNVGVFLDNGTLEAGDVYGMVTKKKFYVPILSGIIGQLIPKSQWRLIPGKGTGLMTFEWTLNQYAFFASGINDYGIYNGSPSYSPGSWTDALIQANQYNIKWSITSISMWFDLWWFDDMVTNSVDQQLMGDGIIITSQGATLGPMYTIANTPSVTNTWHINNGILSLRTVMFYFLLNDYQRYSFVRKHFRVSHNLANMQLKVGTDFIPQTPIQGHAGNLECNSVIPYDCTPFYVELLRTFNHFFHADSNFSIHPTNFVLNDRFWDFNATRGTAGNDLTGQQSFFHETRAVGKALYAFDLLADPYDHSVLSGLDTTKVRPIELVLQANSDQVNNGDLTRASTMYIWLLHDILVNFKMGQMEAAGYG